MLKKGTKLYSIIKGNCPRCHEEFMYQTKNLYQLSETLKMNERCSHCNLKYKIEPSFFYGSMYISYGVGIGFALAAFIVSNLIFGSSLKIAFAAIVFTLIVCLPIILRLSRNIWINLFVKYDKTILKE